VSDQLIRWCCIDRLSWQPLADKCFQISVIRLTRNQVRVHTSMTAGALTQVLPLRP
jgi:hypothetical protein